jgi:hypothetical protein
MINEKPDTQILDLSIHFFRFLMRSLELLLRISRIMSLIQIAGGAESKSMYGALRRNQHLSRKNVGQSGDASHESPHKLYAF